ncbi:DUF397 domain-containing protein [Streptomyces sp. UNOC14_S4]|uniref:DUF397 domain-containing protein n=1 Tax=Streptomyces sp. UNOC14_S4 TaxID=2872340 RepID=UPI001E56B855|nr:DUF397 domain-containing protein [Streptomyces sp. UNOC14_S4]MCC3768600.1 DUF397 domain-containing protein [Streptomyces sp. UNOC14_S4]
MWHRSSYSTGMNNCVETADGPVSGPLTVRDSKTLKTSETSKTSKASKGGVTPALSFPSATWLSFVGELRGGSFAPPGRSSPGD